jgi:penicillin amidase
VVGKIFDIDLSSSGDSFTVAAAHHRINREATPFRQHHGASLRAIYDLSDLDRSLFIQSTGQSGNPLSRFYRSFARTWRDGGYVPMTTDRSEIQAGAIGTLFLDPVR